MALNKQMILNELGSVMNKLQSADCGCMGKLFSTAGQPSNQGGQGTANMCSPQPTCGGYRHGHCQGHGYGCGDPNNGYRTPSGNEPSNTHTPRIGMQCNPQKLYAETYNYLNSNLMQPVVNEVYQDLKSINPSNSVMNNPIASQLGLSHPNSMAGMSGNTGMAQNQMPGCGGGGMQDNVTLNHQIMGNQQMDMGNQQNMSNFGNMGPNIVKMMNGSGTYSGKTNHVTPQGQISGEMESTSNNASAFGGMQTGNQFMQQSNMINTMNSSPQSPMAGNMQQNTGQPGAYTVNYSNPAAQQMSKQQNKPNYGKHTPGMTKFIEMFPGVMGGDLGFDPMSIAFQMNPSNKQQAAIGQINKLMNGHPIERVLDSKTNAMQPTLAAMNVGTASMNPTVNRQNVHPSSQPLSVQQGAPQQNYANIVPNQPIAAQQQTFGHIPQQQMYTAVTGVPTMNQTQSLNQELQKVDPYAQQNMDLTAQGMSPNNLPRTYDGQINNASSDTLNHQPPLSLHPTPDQVLKEPIFPVDTSRNIHPQIKYQNNYEYNTLGQPVEMLPARLYHPVPDNSPQQTLSPQPIAKMRTDQSRFIVKNTVSKTSLMGNKPVGRTPSRGQLQHIYNQYKGSHSYTQQNIRSPGQGATFSEGKINIASTPHHRHVPVERIAGDTLANNQLVNNQIPVKGRHMGHLGDGLADNKPYGDIAPAHEGQIRKTRNGLQDLVYTSYPTSAAWSFHGNNQRSSAYPSMGYRRRA